MLSCDVIIWDDNTPLFYFSWKLHSLIDAVWSWSLRGIAYIYVWLESSYDPPEGHPGQLAYTFLICILSTSFISVSIFSVCCYSRVSISVVGAVRYISRRCTQNVHRTLLGVNGVSHSQISIPNFPRQQLPLKKETPRWQGLYRKARQLLPCSIKQQEYSQIQ